MSQFSRFIHGKEQADMGMSGSGVNEFLKASSVAFPFSKPHKEGKYFRFNLISRHLRFAIFSLHLNFGTKLFPFRRRF